MPTDFVRPSDGRVQSRPFVNMNTAGYKEGDRVIFRSMLNGHQAGEIKARARDDNSFVIAGNAEQIDVRKILGRIPADCPEQVVITTLNQLNRFETKRDQDITAAHKTWERMQAAILKGAGIQ